MTKFGSKNADAAYALLSDGMKHESHEFNQHVGWDWRKAVSLVRKYGQRTGEFTIHDEPMGQFKRYWLVPKSTGIVEELANLKTVREAAAEHGIEPAQPKLF